MLHHIKFTTKSKKVEALNCRLLFHCPIGKSPTQTQKEKLVALIVCAVAAGFSLGRSSPETPNSKHGWKSEMQIVRRNGEREREMWWVS